MSLLSLKYIKGLDGLRAVSILFVVISHLLPAGLPVYETRYWHLFSGTTGVRIFFVISGYLITSLLMKEREKYGGIYFKYFFVRRFLRLLPPLLVFYLITIIAMLSGAIPENYIGLVYAIFYVYNFVPNTYYTYELGHMWSLAVEEQFYFTWPFLLNKVKIISRLFKFVILFIVVSIFATTILPQLSIAENYHVSRWFFPASAPIFIGSGLALLVYYKKSLAEKWSRSKASFISGAILYSSPLYLPTQMLPYTFVIQSLGIALWLLYISGNQGSILVKGLEIPPLRYIGKISYGIYVYQGFFLRTGPGSEFYLQQYPVNIILTLILAILSYELLEKRILKIKEKYRRVSKV